MECISLLLRDAHWRNFHIRRLVYFFPSFIVVFRICFLILIRIYLLYLCCSKGHRDHISNNRFFTVESPAFNLIINPTVLWDLKILSYFPFSASLYSFVLSPFFILSSFFLFFFYNFRGTFILSFMSTFFNLRIFFPSSYLFFLLEFRSLLIYDYFSFELFCPYFRSIFPHPLHILLSIYLSMLTRTHTHTHTYIYIYIYIYIIKKIHTPVTLGLWIYFHPVMCFWKIKKHEKKLTGLFQIL